MLSRLSRPLQLTQLSHPLQHVRRRLLKKAAARQRVVNEWSPSVRANLRQQRVYQVYNTTIQAQHKYTPARLKPATRPAYMRTATSHAVQSYNVAIDLYNPKNSAPHWRRSSTARLSSGRLRRKSLSGPSLSSSSLQAAQ